MRACTKASLLEKRISKGVRSAVRLSFSVKERAFRAPDGGDV
jgi:hypothetical protein